MRALQFWRTVVEDRSQFLEGLLELLDEHSIRYCAIGGVAVNAYAEPVVTLELDLVVATDDLERVRRLVGERYEAEEFEHDLNVRDPGSRLQVQFQLDAQLAEFAERANVREVLGVAIPVAAPDDLMASKIRAVSDERGRPSKRQMGLADIARLLEAFPELEPSVPTDVRARLFW